MLLEFRTKNFKSFKDEVIFKMIPAPKIKDLDYSVLNYNINSKKYKALSSAVIYGPNAAGKTNIISAMDVLKNIIIKGDIKNPEKTTGQTMPLNELELIPNISNEKQPVCFYIKFFIKNILFEFELNIDIGSFLNRENKKKILLEKLSINEKEIYIRDKKLEIINYKEINDFLVDNFTPENEKIAKNNLLDDELFLCTYFKTLYSFKIEKIIKDWFYKKLIIIYRFNFTHTMPYELKYDKKNKYYRNNYIDKAIKIFGLDKQKIAYFKKDDKNIAFPFSIIETKNNERFAIPCNLFESYGTIRFLDILPIIYSAICNGETIIIDEFDASIHPMVLMSFINIFHNNNINLKKAQLIFNTHNPIFLNRNLFRRDEIKFFERNDITSRHYSLSDFGTSGENGVRNTEDYMKNYFINQYGAIKNIDLSDVFIEYIKVCNNEEMY